MIEFPITAQFTLTNTGQVIKLQGASQMPFAVYCSKFFQKTQKIIDQSNNIVLLKINDKQLDIKSQTSLSSLGIKNNSNIEVTWTPKVSLDQENMIEKSRSRQDQMRKRKRTKKEKDPIKDTLIDMAMLSNAMKAEIFQGNFEGRYISPDQALQLKTTDKYLFPLGLLAKFLEILGINAVIEKGYGRSDKKSLDFANTLLQFLVNGMINYRKFCLKFKLEEKLINEIAKDQNEKEEYNEYFKTAIVDKFDVDDPDDIIIISYTEGLNIVFLLIVKKNNFVLTKDELKKKFQYERVSDLQDFSEGPVLDTVILTKNMLDPNGDQQLYGQNEDRGGNMYLPPNGWDRYGVRVKDIYDEKNNDWISWEFHKEGQWSICYRGIMDVFSDDDPSKYEKEEDCKHPGSLVSKGILCYQDPGDMANTTAIITIPNGEKYQLGFMLRVEPSLIRAPKSKPTYWFLNGTPDELRPYGILIKQFYY